MKSWKGEGGDMNNGSNSGNYIKPGQSRSFYYNKPLHKIYFLIYLFTVSTDPLITKDHYHYNHTVLTSRPMMK